jgi:hypothetical protein
MVSLNLNAMLDEEEEEEDDEEDFLHGGLLSASGLSGQPHLLLTITSVGSGWGARSQSPSHRTPQASAVIPYLG